MVLESILAEERFRSFKKKKKEEEEERFRTLLKSYEHDTFHFVVDQHYY